MELSGAEIFIRCLKEEKVEYLFGYPGGAVLNLYDALEQQNDIKHILVRHEQAATHAADGYARSTGRPGVVLVTSGPGATNAITGIATAYMDSIPMVVFTGQVFTSLIGNDAFQEVDSIGITRPCVKHNFMVKDVKDLSKTIKKAFYIATTGRPGPVVIDLPKDITADKTLFDYPENISIRSYNPVVKGHAGQIKRAVEMILNARRPIVYSGGGVVLDGASAELTEFVQTLNFPITSTMMGLGAYPATDRQFLGMLGMHGTYEANMAMHECDLLIAIGARFDDRVTGKIEKFCPTAKIIHIDIDPASISKNVKVDVPIVGAVSNVLKEMFKLLRVIERTPDEQALNDWWGKIKAWRKIECLKFDTRGEKIKPQAVVQTLYDVTQGDAYVTTDVGQHQMWAAQFYKSDHADHWISSGGAGTMGFGFPAAIGAQLGHPDATVAVVTGEGSIQMCIQELSTCLQYGFPIKIVNLNNGFLGMVRQWQEFFYGKRYAMSYMESLPDFVKLAESYGHVGIRIEKPEDVKPAMEEAMKLKDRLVFLDYHTDPTENVYPMIPAGAGLNEMLLV